LSFLHFGSKLLVSSVAVPLCVHQQADLISLGKVVLALACNSLAGIQRENLQKAMELVSINYSSDLKNLILWASLFLTHTLFCLNSLKVVILWRMAVCGS